MAFKPFDYFRKHQKPIFAVMAIICMLVFILQFAQGDAIQQFLAWMGSNSAKGEVVLTVNKEQVHRGDLALLQDQRQLATEFLSSQMGMAAFQARQESQTALKPTGAAKDAASHPLIVEIMDEKPAPPGQPPKMTTEEKIGALEMVLQRGALPGRGALSPADEKALGELLVWLRYSSWDGAFGLGRGNFIFGGSASTEDLLDHKIWLHQADILNIQLVEEDLRKLVNFDAGSVVVAKEFSSDETVKKFLTRDKNAARQYRPEELERAVANEYRAAIAQQILTGRGQGLRAKLTPIKGYEIPVGSMTLQEFAVKYRAMNTKVTVALLPVPTQNFKPDGTPTQKELLELFNRFRKTEAKPDNSTTGLKIPRRVKMDYIAVPTDLPAIKKDGELRLLAQTQFLRRLMANATTGIGIGGGVIPAIVNDLTPLIDDKDPLFHEYMTYAENQRSLAWLTPPLPGPAPEELHWWLPTPPKPLRFQFDKIHDKSMVEGVLTNPRAIATLVGLSALRTPMTSLMFEPYCVDAAARKEQEERDIQARCALRVIAEAGLVAGTPFGNPVLPFAFVAGYQPRDPLSYALMAPTFWSEATSAMAKVSLGKELSAFVAQLQEYRNSPKEAARFLERVNAGNPVKLDTNLQAVAELNGAVELKAGNPLLKDDTTLQVGDKVYTFHLKGMLHSMKDFADKSKLDDKKANPEMAGLLKAFDSPDRKAPMQQRMRDGSTPPLPTLSDMVFNQGYPPYQVHAWSIEMGDLSQQQGGLQMLPFVAKEAYLFWYSDSKPEREPATLDEVLPEAEQAWKTVRARRMALDAANKIKSNLTAPSGPDRMSAEKDLQAAVAKAGLTGVLPDSKPIFLENVSEVELNVKRPDLKSSYLIWSVNDPSKIKYPKSNLATQLLTLKDPGDSIVVSDQPEDYRYVAVLMSRQEPNSGELELAIKSIGSQSEMITFWQEYALDPRRKAYAKDLLRRLRVEAVGADKVDENGNYILPDSVKRGNIAE